MGRIVNPQMFFDMLDLLEILRRCWRDGSVVSALAMIEMCVTPEKVGKEIRLLNAVEALGSSRAAAIPTKKSCRSSAYR
jgi:hypothetical protein